MNTIKEVARLAGVSQATVSRVMSGSARVREKTRRRVENAMAELDYSPNSFARSLASNRSSSIGLVITQPNAGTLGRMMLSIEKTLRDNDISLLIAVASPGIEHERKAIDFLRSRRCDGLILQVDHSSDESIIDLSTQLPMVIVNRYIEAVAPLCVYADNQMGAYHATRHLIQLGHRRIVCIKGPLIHQDARQRLAGFNQAMQEAQLLDQAIYSDGDYLQESGSRAILKLAATNTAYTAIFACNDAMACGALAQLNALGKQVPRDVSLIGYDNEPFTPYINGGLTTIHSPAEEMGEAAAHLIQARVNHLTVSTFPAVQPRLKIRATTATCPDNAM